MTTVVALMRVASGRGEPDTEVGKIEFVNGKCVSGVRGIKDMVDKRIKLGFSHEALWRLFVSGWSNGYIYSVARRA